MTVTLISLSARGENDIAAAFAVEDGGHVQKETYLISPADVADLKLSCGPCSPDCMDAVAKAAEVRHAVKQGLYLLGYGACSPKQLCQKLMQKNISKDTAEEAVRTLRAEGYLNPVTDALREAERCVEKLWGKKRIAATLFAKGYTNTVTEKVLLTLEDMGIDYAELCEERICRTVEEIPEDREKQQKLFAALTRYGFSSEEIREAFRRIREKESI